MDLPDGMTVTPMGYPLMAEAFFGCASFAISEPRMVAAFEKETGYSLKSLANRTGLKAMIDQSTGYELKIVAAWFDWVAINIFGTDKDIE